MFTGIVQALGTIVASTDTGAGKRLTVSLGDLAKAPITHGDSVCCSGVCLTAVTLSGSNIQFDVITETLRRSTLGGKKVGDRINLELSLRPDSFVGGHFVQGHVDAIARVAAIKKDPHDWRITFELPADLSPYFVPKGSVAVDGVSMTIAETGLGKGGGGGGTCTFTLAVIPTTLAKTTLGNLSLGDAINVETDILARTVVHCLQQMRAGAGGAASAPGITLDSLRSLGMA